MPGQFGFPSANQVTPAQLNTPGINVKLPATINVSGDAARVGGTVVSNKRLVEYFLKNGGQTALNELITTVLVDQEAAKQGIKINPAELTSKYMDFKKQVLQQAPPGYTWAQVLSQEGRSEDYALAQVKLRLELEKLVAKTIKPANLNGQIHIYHILIPTAQLPGHTAKTDAEAKAKIDQIAADIAANKISFKEAAKVNSEDDATKGSGGDLGWVSRGQGLDDAFEKAAFMLKEGEVSAPVKSKFGYHLIYLERVGANASPAEIKKLNDDQLAERVPQQIRPYLQQLRARTPVENLLLPSLVAGKAAVPAPAAKPMIMAPVKTIKVAPAKPAAAPAKKK